MAAPGVRISFEQTLTFEASKIAIEGATIRNGAKLEANGIRFKKSVKLREGP
jgi:hypothetical protein